MNYSPNRVERLLGSYIDIRCTLEGKGSQLPDKHMMSVVTVDTPLREAPLGATKGNPWPFMEPRGARTRTDGKAQARSMEDLHCAVIDIEDGLNRISAEDRKLLIQYYIMGAYTLEELARERGVASRGSLLRRIQRAVRNLSLAMEYGNDVHQ